MLTLTEKQEAFASWYVKNGGNAAAAARMAGYAEPSARQTGLQLLTHAGVQAAIHMALMRSRTRSGVIGLRVMEKIARNEDAPAAARVSAARALMEHAGLLGTAKEVEESRKKAAEDAKVIDYQRILDGLAARRNTANSNAVDPAAASLILS